MKEVKIFDNLLGPDGLVCTVLLGFYEYGFKEMCKDKGGRIVKLTIPLLQVSRFRRRGDLGCTTILYTDIHVFCVMMPSRLTATFRSSFLPQSLGSEKSKACGHFGT